MRNGLVWHLTDEKRTFVWKREMDLHERNRWRVACYGLSGGNQLFFSGPRSWAQLTLMCGKIAWEWFFVFTNELKCVLFSLGRALNRQTIWHEILCNQRLILNFTPSQQFHSSKVDLLFQFILLFWCSHDLLSQFFRDLKLIERYCVKMNTIVEAECLPGVAAALVSIYSTRIQLPH